MATRNGDGTSEGPRQAVVREIVVRETASRRAAGPRGVRRLRLGSRMAGTAAVFTALAALTGAQFTGLGLAPVASADALPAPADRTLGPTATGTGSAAVDPGTTSPFGPGVSDGPALAGAAPVDGGGTVPLTQPPTAPVGSPFADPLRNGPALPETVFAAYRKAEAALALRSPACHLPWQLLAAIGEVESGQAGRGAVDAAGTTYRPILGPALNGAGFAAISDTDGGRFDGDGVWDRAVGPMQFIPSIWASWGVDANADGKADPNNVFDAAEAAGRYLCAGGRDLSDPAQLDRAVLGYNHSAEYLRTVRNWMAHFSTGSPVTTPGRTAPNGPFAPLTLPTPPAPVIPGIPTGTQPSGVPQPSTTPGTPAVPSTSTTPSGAPSTSPSTSPSGTPSTSPSTGATPSDSASPSASPSTGPTTTPSGTPSATASPSGSASPTATAEPTGTPTATPTATPTTTPTGTPTACATPTDAPSGTPTAGTAPSAPASATPSATATPTATAPGCPTPTPTATATQSGAPTGSAAPSAAAPSTPLTPSGAPSAR
ncbi:lytic transglycosylase domain-containing protein [Streptomyces sp. BE303]|uniref:lytic transglycosylase domain-containing protein n=1 Tax=Streptomyces sp. BE303 TaxID=3002528 RepID=UPI002E7654BE|nr:lytic murein transglycosylase [Streptomyces sp. BE303]MED7953900.1 lytic murein transglycosylase [Streptomyces sp. BE303]